MTVAILSNVPIDQLETIRPIYRTFALVQGKRLRIRFRGPRSGADRSYCLKKNARAFSVYID